MSGGVRAHRETSCGLLSPPKLPLGSVSPLLGVVSISPLRLVTVSSKFIYLFVFTSELLFSCT